MPWIEKELSLEFKNQIEMFPTNQLPQIYELLEKYKEKNVIIFKNRKEMDDYLK